MLAVSTLVWAYRGMTTAPVSCMEIAIGWGFDVCLVRSFCLKKCPTAIATVSMCETGIIPVRYELFVEFVWTRRQCYFVRF